MLKTVALLLALNFFAYAHTEPTILHGLSVEIEYKTPDGKVKKTTISRDTDLRCREIPFNAREYWDGDYASGDVAGICKKSFITSAGKISPMQIEKGLETYGELEVLEFLEDMQDDINLLFVDSRKEGWFKSISIPSAINIPFSHVTVPKNAALKKEVLKRFGVKGEKGGYDFSEAKTVLFFCNGVWCRQSPQMIEELLSLGYPAKKMKWYRGGMQSWLSLGMTATR